MALQNFHVNMLSRAIKSFHKLHLMLLVRNYASEELNTGNKVQCNVMSSHKFDLPVYSEQNIMLLLGISPFKKYIIITLSVIVGHFAGENGEFGRIKYILACWNKPVRRQDQTVIRCKQRIKIEKPLHCSCHFLTLFVKEKSPCHFQSPTHGWKHRKQQKICKFSISSVRGRRSTNIREAPGVITPVVAPWPAAKCM